MRHAAPPSAARAARARTLALAAVVATAAGCKLGRAYVVRDTEGWEYRASCDGRGCAAEVETPHPPGADLACGPGARPGFALAGRRVVVACHACVGAGAPRVDPARCRAVRCGDDRDCPPQHGGAATRCVRGLCQVPSHDALDPVAAAGLCMTGAGPSGERGVAREARLAFARAACSPDGRCTAPAGCREP